MPAKVSKKVLMLLGLPGAGKGTQADFLSEKFGFYHFETSRIIKETFQNPNISDKKIKKEREKYLSGQLNTPAFVANLVIERIKSLKDRTKGIVFDGSPRTLYEAKKLFPLLKKYYGKKNIYAFYLNITPEETLKRNMQRRICQQCGKSTIFKNYKNVKCPVCGGKLIKRDLDKPEIIKKRIINYKKFTFPVIKYFKKMGILRELDGSKSIEEINNQLADLLM